MCVKPAVPQLGQLAVLAVPDGIMEWTPQHGHSHRCDVGLATRLQASGGRTGGVDALMDHQTMLSNQTCENSCSRQQRPTQVRKSHRPLLTGLRPASPRHEQAAWVERRSPAVPRGSTARTQALINHRELNGMLQAGSVVSPPGTALVASTYMRPRPTQGRNLDGADEAYPRPIDTRIRVGSTGRPAAMLGIAELSWSAGRPNSERRQFQLLPFAGISPNKTVEETMAMTDEIEGYVEEHAPELDPNEVRGFIADHAKPTSEPGTHIEWAVQQMRRHKERDEEDGPSLEIVEEEMRRRDETRG